jgi:hypothetical protein
MAELLTAHGWREPGSVGAILSEGLHDSYFVVGQPSGRSWMPSCSTAGLFVLK